MKKILFFASAIVALTLASCTDKAATATSDSIDTTEVVADSLNVDSVSVDSVEDVD